MADEPRRRPIRRDVAGTRERRTDRLGTDRGDRSDRGDRPARPTDRVPSERADRVPSERADRPTERSARRTDRLAQGRPRDGAGAPADGPAGDGAPGSPAGDPARMRRRELRVLREDQEARDRADAAERRRLAREQRLTRERDRARTRRPERPGGSDRPDRSDRPGSPEAERAGAVALRERPRAAPGEPGAARPAAASRAESPAATRRRSAAGAGAGVASRRPPTGTPRTGPPVRAYDRGPATRTGRRALRIAVTVLSVLIFVISGTAWAALSTGLSTSSSALGNTVGNAPDGATDILLVGSDSRNDAQGRPLPQAVLSELGASNDDGSINTDTMILVRIPNDGRRAVAFSIPRDSYVRIPGTMRMDKINSAYPGAKAAEADRLVAAGDADPADVDVKSSEAGRRELVAAVGQLTGLTVDHYAEVNLLGFFQLTQAIGGVDVCLKNPVNDEKSGAHFAAGPRVVAGHDALAFVRQRYGLPNGDLDRVRRQQAFLAGLSHKILSAGTLTNPVTLSSLISAVKTSVTLDGDWDLLGFAQQMQGVSGGAVAFLTIPTRGTENTGQADVLKVDPFEVQRYVRDAIGDGAPAPDGPPPATVPVDVRNASGTPGAAARVVGVLGARGFTRTVSGNADPTVATATARSGVLAGPGADAGAALVAGTLGNLPVRPDPTVPPGTVRVVLAADYTGPGATDPPVGAAAPAPPPPPPITADGVPCVD